MKRLVFVAMVALLCASASAQTLQAEWNFAEATVVKNDIYAFSDVSGKNNKLQGRMQPNQLVDTDQGKALRLNLSEFVIDHVKLTIEGVTQLK